MAAFEENGIVINTHLVALVGQVKAPPVTAAEYSVSLSGVPHPIQFRFKTKEEAEASRKKLVSIIDAIDSYPR